MTNAESTSASASTKLLTRSEVMAVIRFLLATDKPSKRETVQAR